MANEHPSQNAIIIARNALIIALIGTNLSVLARQRREHLIRHGENYDKIKEDMLYVGYMNAEKAIRTNGRLTWQDLSRNTGSEGQRRIPLSVELNDLLCWLRQYARITYEEWERFVEPNPDKERL